MVTTNPQPLFRWVRPDDGLYQRCAPLKLGLLLDLLLDLRMGGGDVWPAGPSAAVAMWNPPGGESEINTSDGGPLGWLLRRDPVALDG